ncbi:MAG: RAMP superfamily CRISPR-associated protein [Sulfolobaceae archaeon]
MFINYNGKGYLIPYIPATSFKGVLRSTVEVSRRKNGSTPSDFEAKVKDFFNELKSGRSVEIFKDYLKDEIELLISSGILDKRYKEYVNNLDESKLITLLKAYFDAMGWNYGESCYVTSDLDRCENLALIEDEDRKKFREAWNRLTNRENFCKTCILYGASGLRASVRFTNFYPIDPFPVRIDRLTHVSIDRRTWAASPRKLYNEEIIAMGTRFLGFALLLKDRYISQLMEDLKLLSEKAEKMEVTLGARGSVGYGAFSLKFGNFIIELSEESILGKLRLNFKSSELNLSTNINKKLSVLKVFYPSYLLSTIEVVEQGA